MRSSVIIALVTVVAGFVLYAVSGCTSQKPVSVGTPAPELVVKDLRTGQKVNIRDFEGKVLFVNFWASWCPPCKEEMPSIETVHREFLARSDFRLITILFKDSNTNGLDYLRSNGYTFPVFEDISGRSSRNFGVTGVPETYIVDKKGLLRRKVIGALDWSAPDEKVFIQNLLNQ